MGPRGADDVPVLLVVYNRPDKTRRVLETVAEFQPRRLYVAADGPRPQDPVDADRCARTRALFDGLGWSCELNTLFQSSHLGLKRGEVAAFDWFFSCVEAGIVLEDDCLPSSDFYPFCAELLNRYFDSPRVLMISGHNTLVEWDAGGASYVFNRTPATWGWAGWRRAWSLYDPAMTSWGDPKARRAVRARLSKAEFRIMKRRFDRVFHGGYDTWDFAWVFAVLLADGVCVMPWRNLVTNIGFDADATHTRLAWPHERGVSTKRLDFPLTHPARIEPDPGFDGELFRRRFPPTRRIVEALPWAVQTPVQGMLYHLLRRRDAGSLPVP